MEKYPPQIKKSAVSKPYYWPTAERENTNSATLALN